MTDTDPVGPPAAHSVPAARVGLPLWGFAGWAGKVYASDTRARDYLEQYARVFGAVEGSSTFYSTPTADTVRRWAEQTPTSFRFCFKLPRQLTHDLLLAGVADDARAFVSHMSILGPRLGPFMVQLPAELGPQHLGRIDALLTALPSTHRFAVEVRHRAFFESAPLADRLRDLLAEHDADRVVLDTTGVRTGPQSHPDVAKARHPKPDLPIVEEATSHRPIVRFIGHPVPSHNEAGLADWAARIARWVSEGRHPYLFIHCPNDLHAPDIARRAHALLSDRIAIDPMPAWPGESRETRTGQLSLL